MHRSFWLSVLLALVVTSGARAQELPSDCREIREGTVQGPSAADSVTIADIDGHQVGDLKFEAGGGQWALDAATIARIQGALATQPDQRSTRRLLWFEGSERIQTDRFVLPGEDSQNACPPAEDPDPLKDGGASSGSADPGPDAEVRRQCRNRFLDWNRAIGSRLGHQRYLAILFGSDGQIINQNKDYGVAGELIYTAVCQQVKTPIPLVKFTQCDLQSAIPKSPEGADAIVRQSGRPEVIETEVIEYPTRQCFGSSADVTFKLGSIDETHTIGLYERYRYTLQVAALSTDHHLHSFGLRSDGDDSRIFDKGPIDDGPEYVASVVLYALPRYIGSLVRGTRQGDLEGLEARAARTYHGRDVVNDHAVADRLGFVVGVGLDHPRDRFVAGLSFELIPGLNVVGVYEWAKLKELAGVAEDDVFAGTAETIPTRDDWEEKAVVGLSLDLRYVAGLFKRGT